VSNPDGVLAAIDACLEDALSDDAMRWAPDEPAPPEHGPTIATFHRGWSLLPATGLEPGGGSVVAAISGVAVNELPSRWLAVQTRGGLFADAQFGRDEHELADWQQDYMRRMTALHGEDTFFLVCTPEGALPGTAPAEES